MNINKLNLVSIIIVFILVGCISDEDNQTDELLKGTEWEWRYLYELSYGSIDTQTFDPFAQFLKQYPSSYSIGDISTIESTEVIPTEGSHITHTLKFIDSQCTYEIEDYSLTMEYKYETKFQLYIFSQKIFLYHTLDTLKVLSDGIYLYPRFDREYEVKKLYSLDNFKANKFISMDTLSVKEKKNYNEQALETYSYQRIDNEVIMTNKNKKCVGTIDKTNWTMKIIQISPERKDLHTFTLK